MEQTKKEEMAASLYAISIVARKLAKELIREKGEKKNVKKKSTDASETKCREAGI